MASCWKMRCCSVPPCLIAYRLPSSLLAYTVPLASMMAAFTHHSKPFGWSETQVTLPSGFVVQLRWLVFWKLHSMFRLGSNWETKYCSGPSKDAFGFERSGHQFGSLQ